MWKCVSLSVRLKALLLSVTMTVLPSNQKSLQSFIYEKNNNSTTDAYRNGTASRIVYGMMSSGFAADSIIT